MLVIWGDGDVVEIGDEEQEALSDLEVEEIVEALATSSKLPIVVERLFPGEALRHQHPPPPRLCLTNPTYVRFH
jgi:hypothetical protein